MKLVGLHEVAQLAGVSRQAVSNWMVRRKDFPLPLANLASGPVWNAETITAWLSSMMPTSTQPEHGVNMKSFIAGYEYSMRDIHEIIGGDTMSYLPQSGGRIVGGRFKKGVMNPQAPYQIIVGDLPQVRRKAELLASQVGVIPVFLKEGPNRWRYHGPMQVVSYSTDQVTVRGTPGAQDREENVAGVLTLADAD